MPVAPFVAFGPSHVVALAATALLIATLGWSSRRQWMGLLGALEKALGVVLISLPVFAGIVASLEGTASLQTVLPLQYCDLATICGGIALFTRRQEAIEIVYFFGLAGTLQGLLTPALQNDFPDLRYFHFFLLHGGVVAAALHLVWIRGHRPRPWSIARMTLATAAYGAVVGLFNWVFGTNFGFLCSKPGNASMMDHLGPWPWYILSLLGMGVVFYTLLDIPFWRQRTKQGATSPR